MSSDQNPLRKYRESIPTLRLFCAAFFAALFMAGSWMVPYAYYSLTPTEDFLDVTAVDVEVVGPAAHELTIEYTSSDYHPIRADIAVYRASPSVRERIHFLTIREFTRPDGTVQVPVAFDEPLATGSYQYELEYTVYLDYNVEKHGSASSETVVVVVA